VIVATQMLESMIDSPIPTRAEASDIANAIFDGADAVMLSAESASGRYPLEAVVMQQRIINKVEDSPRYLDDIRARVEKEGADPKHVCADSIVSAAMNIAVANKAKVVIAFTASGSTAARASRCRMHVPVVAMTPSLKTARALALYWGVFPEALSRLPTDSFDDLLRRACSVAWDKGFAADLTDKFVVTAGLPFGRTGEANVIRVLPAAGPQVVFDDTPLELDGMPLQPSGPQTMPLKPSGP